MTKLGSYEKQRYLYLIKNVPQYLLVIVFLFLITLFASPILDNNINIAHTIMESFCIFIGISTFFITWHSYRETLGIFREFGFGLLAASIICFFHTYSSIGAGLTIQAAADLTVKYWAIGILVESLTILDISLNLKEAIINKWSKLALTLLFSFGPSFALFYNPGILPVLFTENGITPLQLIYDSIIIIICFLSLYNMRKKLRGENGETYKYIFIAVLFIIPSQLSFTRYDIGNRLFSNYAHVLRMVYYYYIYRAVYVRSIELPYKRLEEAYKEKENANARIREVSYTLNDTLDALPIGILKCEADSSIKYMNKRLEEILACDRNDFYGMTLTEMDKRFPAISGEKNILHLIKEGRNEPINAIVGINNLKNDHISLSVTSQRIRDGLIIYINEVIKQQDIRKFQIQTQMILNAVTNAILIIDKNKKIILHNEAFCRVFETEGKEFLGMDIAEFNRVIKNDGISLGDVLNEEKHLEHPQEIYITTFKGNRLELLSYKAPIKNVDGEVIGAICISTDITYLKKQQNNIQQQEKLALIGQMSAGIIHEIKNPLATIKGLSQLISAKTTVDKIKDYTAVINSAINDITNVVNEFLNFAGPKQAVATRTSINKIVESMQLIIETQCYTKNIRSRFHYYHWPMEITADETKVKQVILNITENSIYAMENTKLPELVASTYYDTEAKEGVIEITDNGTGMSPDVLSKLGTPFFTTKEKGTGLGLRISYEIMQEHKGRIEVKSEEGKGTTFKIIFTQIEDLI